MSFDKDAKDMEESMKMLEKITYAYNKNKRHIDTGIGKRSTAGMKKLTILVSPEVWDYFHNLAQGEEG